MRFDRSDVTAVVAIALAAGFAVVATGSMTLRVTDQPLALESRVAERALRVQARVVERSARAQARVAQQARGAQARVAERIRVEVAEVIEREVEGLLDGPSVYVDGVLVAPGTSLREFDPTEIRSVTVLRGTNEILIESASDPEARRPD